MRLFFISLITPYKENVRGTSALAYHLLKGVKIMHNAQGAMHNEVRSGSEEAACIIYSFNANGLTREQIQEVEKELGAKIKILSLPRWYRWMFKFHLLFLRVFLKYPFVNYIKLPKKAVEEIKSLSPDMIWVNSEEMSRIPKQFPGIRRMQLGPDVESLYYYRMMGRRFVMNDVVDYWKCAMMYRKYARLERSFCIDDNYTYYAVGETDIEHLRQLNPNVNCQFLRHPHYDVKAKQEIHFHQPKIKLLIAGRYDLYMKQTADEVLKAISKKPLAISPTAQKTHADCAGCADCADDFMPQNTTFSSSGGTEGGKHLRDHFSITFLGKGWEQHAEALRRAGYDVEHIAFAPDYIEEVCKHDIQLTPICIGTGTKGKVLDALANGLLVLGTPFALENIAVEHGKSCIEWRNADEVPGILMDIANNREKYEQIATAGRDAVLKEHNPALIAAQLFRTQNSQNSTD